MANYFNYEFRLFTLLFANDRQYWSTHCDSINPQLHHIQPRNPIPPTITTNKVLIGRKRYRKMFLYSFTFNSTFPSTALPSPLSPVPLVVCPSIYPLFSFGENVYDDYNSFFILCYEYSFYDKKDPTTPRTMFIMLVVHLPSHPPAPSDSRPQQ